MGRFLTVSGGASVVDDVAELNRRIDSRSATQAAIAAAELVGAAPTTLDTLAEISDALDGQAGFSDLVLYRDGTSALSADLGCGGFGLTNSSGIVNTSPDQSLAMRFGYNAANSTAALTIGANGQTPCAYFRKSGILFNQPFIVGGVTADTLAASTSITTAALIVTLSADFGGAGGIIDLPSITNPTGGLRVDLDDTFHVSGDGTIIECDTNVDGSIQLLHGYNASNTTGSVIIGPRGQSARVTVNKNLATFNVAADFNVGLGCAGGITFSNGFSNGQIVFAGGGRLHEVLETGDNIVKLESTKGVHLKAATSNAVTMFSGPTTVASFTAAGLVMQSKKISGLLAGEGSGDAARWDELQSVSTAANAGVAAAATAQNTANNAASTATTAFNAAAAAQATAYARVRLTDIPQPALEFMPANTITGTTMVNTGTYQSKPTLSFVTLNQVANEVQINGKPGTVWRFDDSFSNVFNLGTPASCGLTSTSPFTISLWFRDRTPWARDGTSNADAEILVFIGDDPLSVSTVYNKFGFSAVNNIEIAGVQATLQPDDRWHLMTHTFDGVSTQRAYLDGVYIGASPTAPAFGISSQLVRIGGGWASGGREFSGNIANVRFWHSCLDDGTVVALYGEQYAANVLTSTNFTEFRSLQHSGDSATTVALGRLFPRAYGALTNTLIESSVWGVQTITMDTTATVYYRANVLYLGPGSVTTTITTLLPDSNFRSNGGLPLAGTQLTIVNGAGGAVNAVFNTSGNITLGQASVTLVPNRSMTLLFLGTTWFRLSDTEF